jgi:lysophospholipase L1-like esterase
MVGIVALAGSYASYPYRTTVAIADLTRDWDGFLIGDFSRPWPLRSSKTALEEYAVVLPDGTKLERYATRRDLAFAEPGSGFLVDRPEIVFRLGRVAGAFSDNTVLSLTLPTEIRSSLGQLSLGIAAALFLLSWRHRLSAALGALGWRAVAVATGSLIVATGGLLSLAVADGVAVWLALMALFVGPLIAAATLLRARAKAAGRQARAWEPLVGLALGLGAVLGSCMLIEVWLGLQDADLEGTSHASAVDENWFELPANVVRLAHARENVLMLPNAWRRQEQTVAGASSAYTWHGALHVHDEWGFRRLNGPFPAKDPETLRIMVLGDSLTYGDGLAEEWTYSRLLERSLQESHRVEIINLGRDGLQSRDILGVLQQFLPLLEPDLVVYAVCLNDFLPSGKAQEVAFAFPFPVGWKKYLLERTSLARLLADAYQELLLALDLRGDFYDDILAGGEEYQARFAHDVAAMNRLVQEARLPPMIGVVFHQFPGGDPRGWDLVQNAEQALEAARFDLISVMSWRERFKGRVFPISRWEGHPNELAHSLIAEHLYEGLLAHDRLREYRVGGAGGSRHGEQGVPRGRAP